MLKSSRPMPVPIAWIRVPTSLEPSIRSKRARSTLRILPLSGRMACTCRWRACVAAPAVEAGALGVEDLALERKDGLHVPVAALLGRAAGRVTFGQEQLAFGRV